MSSQQKLSRDEEDKNSTRMLHARCMHSCATVQYEINLGFGSLLLRSETFPNGSNPGSLFVYPDHKVSALFNRPNLLFLGRVLDGFDRKTKGFSRDQRVYLWINQKPLAVQKVGLVGNIHSHSWNANGLPFNRGRYKLFILKWAKLRPRYLGGEWKR